MVIDELGVGCDEEALAPFIYAAIERIAATGAAVVFSTHMDWLIERLKKCVKDIKIMQAKTNIDGIPTYEFEEVAAPTLGISHGRGIAKAWQWPFLKYLPEYSKTKPGTAPNPNPNPSLSHV